MTEARKFYEELFRLLPNATIDTDNDGQVIVYTNLKESDERDEHNQPLEVIDMEATG